MRKAVLAAASLLLVVGAWPAGAEASTPEVTHTAKDAGRCVGGASTYSLAVSRYDRNTLRVRFLIAHSSLGQTWQIFGSDNGTRIFAVKRVVSSDRIASVRHQTRDRHGVDRVKVAANNLDTGEACSARVAGF